MRAYGRVYMTLLALVVLGLVSVVASHKTDSTVETVRSDTAVGPQRIVSLSPSITESLFALGVGDRIVGVTNFCDYPPAAQTKTKVGGYYDLNYEAIMAQSPDLVVCLPEHAGQLPRLKQLGLTHMTVDHRHIETILDSLVLLGRRCGVLDKADTLVEGLRTRMQVVQNRMIDRASPRVLVCVGRNMGSSTLDEVYVAGAESIFNEMIQLAGGVNAYQGDQPYPLITAEGLLRLQPDVILDMVADLEQQGLTKDAVLKQWQSLPDLKAVEQKRVMIFTEDFVVIPGPRFILILEMISQAIHPKGTG